jgi:hypothetical protein
MEPGKVDKNCSSYNLIDKKIKTSGNQPSSTLRTNEYNDKLKELHNAVMKQ